MDNLAPDLIRALIAIEHALSAGDAAAALAQVRAALDLALPECRLEPMAQPDPATTISSA